jgi:NADH-quinone oxidoreductase subunit C
MSELLSAVCERFGDAILDSHDSLGDATVLIEGERLVEVMTALRDEAGFKFNLLIDLTAVDYLGREPRFEVVYHLASLDTDRASEPSRLPRRLRVKVGVAEVPAQVASLVSVWPAANWMEREVWDMYGVRFEGHPDLRRLLLYEEFKGHPLRKDYPKERRQPLVGRNN